MCFSTFGTDHTPYSQAELLRCCFDITLIVAMTGEASIPIAGTRDLMELKFIDERIVKFLGNGIVFLDL